jgi:uncharacterized protein YndB with AHSA1/START domain
MRKRLGVAAIAIAALVGVLWTIGWLLPAGHVARCQTRIAQPPDRLFAVITDYAAHPTWRDDLDRVEVLDATPGHEVVREHSSFGILDLHVERVEAPILLVTRVSDPDGAFGGTWTFELSVIPGATQLAITERGEVYQPFFRLLSRTVFSPTSTIQAYQKALGRRFSQDVFITCSSTPE